MSPVLKETPYFFQNGSHPLFGVLHGPAEAAKPTAFVFCHPLAEEKLWAHRVFVSYARQLAAAGHPVLRFDLSGNGDSGGSFSDLSMESLSSDVRCAIAELRRSTGVAKVTLLGLRLGANLAMRTAESEADVDRLVLWSPITDGERYVQDLLRINLMTQMATYKTVRQERPELMAEMQQGKAVNVDGYEMGWPLCSSISLIKPDAVHSFAGRCLIVQIDKQPRPAPELQQVARTYLQSTSTFAQEDAFWKEIATFYQHAPNLFRVTTEWLSAD